MSIFLLFLCLPLGMNIRSWDKNYQFLVIRIKKDLGLLSSFLFNNNFTHIGTAVYCMTHFHSLLIWIYKQQTERVTYAHFSLCLPLLPPQMLLQHGTGSANVPALWRVMTTVRMETPIAYRKSIWGYSSVTGVYSSRFYLYSGTHSLSDNAFSLSNGCIESKETKTGGIYTPNWNYCTRVSCVNTACSNKCTPPPVQVGGGRTPEAEMLGERRTIYYSVAGI